ncbi:hypothetical protein [Bradyrhizobium sp. SBR1B]|uniref:hypothetical protein n=1 Tax=Bradyrhizobium sp. SBR1B TaxID=2663836 RepID=UPI0016057205|nr:hypothetical protein [Bradyrhizobium sp. SBR1B]
MIEPADLRVMLPPMVDSSARFVLLLPIQAETSPSGVPIHSPAAPPQFTPAIAPSAKTPLALRSTVIFWPRSHEFRSSGESRSSLMRNSACTNLRDIGIRTSCTPAALT